MKTKKRKLDKLALKLKSTGSIGGKTFKKIRIQSKFIQQLSEGETNQNKLVSTLAKEMKVPKAQIKEAINERADIVEHAISDVLAQLADKALRCITLFNPEDVQNSYRPLTTAIMIDKLLKIREVSQLKGAPTTQELLLSFVKDNNMTFQQLKLIIDENKLPDSLPPEIYRQLQAILKNLPNKTIETNPSNNTLKKKSSIDI